MRRFISDCTACGWESASVDLEPVAAVLGAEHLAQAHAPVLFAGDASFIRLWQYDAIRVDAVGHVRPEAHGPDSSREQPAAHAAAKPVKQARGR